MGPRDCSDHEAPTTLEAVAPRAVPPGYELLGEVGRGGMGVVYRARDQRLNREVAIKLLRDDLPPETDVAARFVAEAQITGQLQHPGVPPVHELGRMADGRPFLAMKLVRGRTLQELLQERPDPGQERGRFLAIFEQICQAVGSAHAHRVIHRDLKPANVMVGAFGEVQVMDWGLAKVLSTDGPSPIPSAPLGADTVAPRTVIETPPASGSMTQTGALMGTPAYMPPEQARGEVHKLDTRSDVFGLGAILCQVLTGLPAYQGANILEVQGKAMRGEQAEALARLDACAAEPELVALCKRCLAPQQEERPADGGAVAQEVASVRAGAEERARQAELERERARVREAEQRRRRRVTGAAASLIAAILAAGISGTTIGLVRANRAAEAERQAHEQAQKRLIQVEKGHEVLTAIFTDLDIRAVRRGPDPLEAVLAKRLVKAAEQLEGEALGDSLQVAAMQDHLGRALLSLGHPKEAALLFEKAWESRKAGLGHDHPDTLDTMNSLALAYLDQWKLDRALPLLEENLRLRQTRLGPDDPKTLESMNRLATAYHQAGQLDRALPLYEQALPLRQARLGADHPQALHSLYNLAEAYREAGRAEKALLLCEEALRRADATLGADHPDTLAYRNGLALAYQEAGQVARALPLYEETLRLRKARLGPDHPDVLLSMHNLACGYSAAGEKDRAVTLFEETVRQRRARLGANDPATLLSMHCLAGAYYDAGQRDKAISLYEDTFRLRKVYRGADHPATLETMRRLAFAYCETNHGEKAVPLFAEYFAVRRRQAGPGGPGPVDEFLSAADRLLACGQYGEAEPYLREYLAVREKTRPDAWNTFHAQAMLGAALLGQKKYAEAELLLLRGYEGMKQRATRIPPEERPRLAQARECLVRLYDAWGKKDEAAKWRSELAGGEGTEGPPGTDGKPLPPVSRER